MSELTITLLRLGYLVLLWLLVLSAIGVLRRDLYGTRITSRGTSRGAKSKNPSTSPTPAVPEPRPGRKATQATRLVVVEGPLTGTTIPLGASAVVIGRAPGCTLVLDDDYSSSKHARVFPQDGRWFVEDMGSTNGTFVADQRVDGPIELAPGTPVRVGRTVFELQR